MVSTLGGSNLSSITKTTPSSVSELLFLAFLLTMSSLSGTEEPELVVLLSDESAVLGALGTSVIGVTSSLRRKKRTFNKIITNWSHGPHHLRQGSTY